MDNYKKKDLKFSFLILLPLLFRLWGEIKAYIFLLKMKMGANPNHIFGWIAVCALTFFYVYYSLYFARRQKKWALKLPYLIFLPLLIMIIMISFDFFLTSDKNSFWESFFWLILLGGPTFLVINIVIFLILKRRVNLAFKEGLPD